MIKRPGLSWIFLSVLISTAALAEPSAEVVIKKYCPSGKGKVFTARTTGYFPHNSRMEGGHRDRMGRDLKTLQEYLSGDAKYVSIAMDSRAFKYGTKVFIPGLTEAQGLGRQIEFRVVDTGGAFRGRGTQRVDLCVANRGESLQPEINARYTMIACQ